MHVLLMLIFGLFGLWMGTELVVKNASAIARKFNVSELFIGLTILAFGTDLPELVVAINGGLKSLAGHDSSGIIVGNAMGSAIAQISLVVGVSSMIYYLDIGKNQFKYLSIELLGAILLLLLVALDLKITSTEGAILLLAFTIYIVMLLMQETRNKTEKTKDKDEEKQFILVLVFLTVMGLVTVGYFSEMVIENALLLTEKWGVKQSFVGAVIIGLGTSLPEMAISVTAMYQKKSGLSIGNIIGSNIFDLLVPIGVSSIIYPVTITESEIYLDLSILTIMSVVVLYFLKRTKGLQKKEGLYLIALFVIYLILKFILG